MMRLKLEIGRSLYGAGYGIISPGGGTAWSPAALFASGEQGVWYDPSDLSTLFQDSAGTIPVTATGQPVGKMLDKSGRSNHATQATSASRPTLQQDGSGKYYLSFDGVDDSMSTAAINFTSSNRMTLVAGVRKSAGVGYQVFAEISANSDANDGSFGAYAPGASNSYDIYLNGATATPNQAITTYTAPVTSVWSAALNLAAATAAESMVQRINGAAPTTTTTGGAAPGGGNFGNHALFIGRRNNAAFPFNGRMYQLIVRGAATADLTLAETFVNSKTGAY